MRTSLFFGIPSLQDESVVQALETYGFDLPKEPASLIDFPLRETGQLYAESFEGFAEFFDYPLRGSNCLARERELKDLQRKWDEHADTIDLNVIPYKPESY